MKTFDLLRISVSLIDFYFILKAMISYGDKYGKVDSYYSCC